MEIRRNRVAHINELATNLKEQTYEKFLFDNVDYSNSDRL